MGLVVSTKGPGVVATLDYWDKYLGDSQSHEMRRRFWYAYKYYQTLQVRFPVLDMLFSSITRNANGGEVDPGSIMGMVPNKAASGPLFDFAFRTKFGRVIWDRYITLSASGLTGTFTGSGTTMQMGDTVTVNVASAAAKKDLQNGDHIYLDNFAASSGVWCSLELTNVSATGTTMTAKCLGCSTTNITTGLAATQSARMSKTSGAQPEGSSAPSPTMTEMPVTLYGSVQKQRYTLSLTSDEIKGNPEDLVDAKQEIMQAIFLDIVAQFYHAVRPEGFDYPTMGSGVQAYSSASPYYRTGRSMGIRQNNLLANTASIAGIPRIFTFTSDSAFTEDAFRLAVGYAFMFGGPTKVLMGPWPMLQYLARKVQQFGINAVNYSPDDTTVRSKITELEVGDNRIILRNDPLAAYNQWKACYLIDADYIEPVINTPPHNYPFGGAGIDGSEVQKFAFGSELGFAHMNPLAHSTWLFKDAAGY